MIEEIKQIKAQQKHIEKILKVFMGMTTDERIPLHVRHEYMDKVNRIIEGA